MKKLLTLFTLLLCVCSGAWADDETIFTYTVVATDVSNQPTEELPQLVGKTATGTIGGTCAFNVTGSSGSNGYFRNVSDEPAYYFGGGQNHIKLTLTGENKFKTGDKVSVTFTTSKANTARGFYVRKTSHTNTTDQLTSEKSKDAKATKTVTLTAAFNDETSIYINRNDGINVFTVTVTREETKTIATQAYAGVKKGSTTLTESTDYTKADNVITLASSYMTTVAPTDVKLINHITYTDSSTKDEDVDVTFGATASEGYFVGTATIASTEYTVKVPVDNTPTIGLSSESGSLTLKSYDVVKSVTTTLTGANLTDGVYNVTATGLNISPASFTVTDGAVSQEFTIATTASTTTGDNVINFTAGEQSVAYTLNVTKPAKRSVSQSVVTEATTWDWTKAPVEDTDILLTKVDVDEATVSTDPVRGDEFLMATLPEVNNNANFNSQALMLNTQYVYRSGNSYKCLQGNSVSFKTTASGTYMVRVYFCNTSNRSDSKKNRRYLYINGENTGVYTLDQTFIPAQAVLTLDGTEQTITIDAKTGEDTPAETMVRIHKIEFIDKVPVTITAAKYATFASDYDLDFSGVDGLYAYTATVAGDIITFNKVTKAKAGEGLLLYSATAKTYNVPVATDSPAAVDGNKLVRGTGAAVASAGDNSGEYNYVLSTNDKGEVNFYLAAGKEVGTNKAYLKNINPTAVNAKFFLPTGEDETDGIKSVQGSKLTVNGEAYNLAGQKVGADYKGIVIVNGKKVIRK